jgi:hypothetical protein
VDTFLYRVDPERIKLLLAILAPCVGTSTQEAVPNINSLSLERFGCIQHVLPGRRDRRVTHEDKKQIFISAVELIGPGHTTMIDDGTHHLNPRFRKRLFQ